MPLALMESARFRLIISTTFKGPWVTQVGKASVWPVLPSFLKLSTQSLVMVWSFASESGVRCVERRGRTFPRLVHGRSVFL